MNILKSIESRIIKFQSQNFERTKLGKNLKSFKNIHKGQNCFIIGNGPSLSPDDLQAIHDKGIITFGTNRIYKLFDKTDWRPTYYVSEDILLMRDIQDIINEMDVRARFIPINLKWYEGVDIPNANYFLIDYNMESENTHNLSLDISHNIICRSTVTTSCLQLAIYMGFQNIYLLGVDHNFAKMIDKNGSVTFNSEIINHFSDDYDKGIVDQGFQVDAATEAYIDVELLSRDLGSFKVYNATRGGKLEVFERIDFDKLLFEFDGGKK